MTRRCYRFGAFELRPASNQLLVEGRDAGVHGVALQLLIALAEDHERTIPHEELIKKVWARTIVEPNALAVRVSELRKVLGHDAITTTRGQGYRLTPPVTEFDEPPHAPQSPALTNLPSGVEPLMGRDGDIQRVREWVQGHALVTVTGAGGIGKTRLTKAVALSLVETYQHGVWWVDLAALEPGADVASAIARAANLQLGDGDPLLLLPQAMRGRCTLLLLDNCEHLADAVAPIVRDVLAAALEVRFLATSQESLRVPTEHVYRLDPLAVPPPGMGLAKARTFGAIQLLEERAMAAHPGFSLTPDTVESAVRLCHELDGLPLAIEMAAALVPVLGLSTVVGLLGKRLEVLQASARDAPLRHQTLLAMLESSHLLLSATEATAFRRLSVFAGSFEFNAARRVLSAGSTPESTQIVALTNLVNKSLLVLQLTEPPRYRMLQTMRQFADAKLADAHEVAAAEGWHGQAMAERAEEAERAYWVMDDDPWLSLYQQDHDDLEAAFVRAREAHNAEVAATTGEALRLMDNLRGDLSSVRRRKIALHTLLPASQPTTRALLLNHMSWYSQIAIPGVSELTIAEQAVAAWRALDDTTRLYLALERLALAHVLRGDRDAALAAQAQAQALEVSGWPPRLLGEAVRLRGFVASHLGDLPLCRELANRELHLAERVRSARTVAAARHNLADALLAAGDADQALALAREGVAESRSKDWPGVLGTRLSLLCAALLVTGDVPGALEAARQSLPLVCQRGTYGILLNHLAWLSARLGHCELGAQLLGCADAWYEVNEGRREPNEVVSANRAGLLIDKAIGPADHARLRGAGARLGVQHARKLAEEALAAAGH